MSEHSTEQIRELVGSFVAWIRDESFAILIHLLGDFDLAEEAMHEAFSACAEPVAEVSSSR